MGKQIEKAASKKKVVGGAGEGQKKPKKSTMKMQKKHLKHEKQVKDVQLKVGPTKRVQKITQEPPIKIAATAPTVPSVPRVKKTIEKKPEEPLVQLRESVKDTLLIHKKKKVDEGALKIAVKKLNAKASRVPLKDNPQVNKYVKVLCRMKTKKNFTKGIIYICFLFDRTALFMLDICHMDCSRSS